MRKTIYSTILLVLFLNNTFSQNWKPIGPFNRSGGNGQGSGMTKTIACHPLYGTLDPFLGTINKTVFAGSPYGGIWITRDDGANWSNSDPLGQYPNLTTDFLPGCGVNDIIVDYSNPTTLYAAINYGGWTSVPSTQMNIHLSVGVYKYTPSTGWVAKFPYAYNSKKTILELTIDPVNPNIIFASTSDGVIRSTNGGTSWNTVLTAGVDKPFRNVVFDPGNPLDVYAAGPEIYKSLDGGVTWNIISSFSTIIPGNTGIVLTNIAPITSTNIYSSIIYLNAAGTRKYAFYNYNGTAWSSPLAFPPLYYEYNYDRFALRAKSISGIDYVFAGQEVVHRFNSTLGSWQAISTYNGNMHADIHDIVIAPDNSSIWVGHDGGVSKATLNLYSGTPNWQTLNTGLNIATIYSFAGAETDPDLYLTGESDNGNSYVGNADENNFNSINWQGYQVCDGGDKMISRINSNDWISRHQMYGGSSIYRNLTGNPFSGWTGLYGTVLPNTSEIMEDFLIQKQMVQDPNNPDLIYRLSKLLIKSDDHGLTGKSIFRGDACGFNTGYFSNLSSIAIAPSNSNYVYITSTNQHILDPTASEKIFMSTNALTCPYRDAAFNCSDPLVPTCECSCWNEITPPFPVGLPELKETGVTSVVVSDKNPNRIWVGFSYSQYTPNFKVWTYDAAGGGGTLWQDWGNGLPDLININCLVYENGSNDGIYAGTDIGVYYRNASMSSWIPFNTNLPNVKVVKMEINYTENTLRVGTLGRGIWKSPLYCPTTGPFTISACNNCTVGGWFWDVTTLNINNSNFSAGFDYFRAVDYILVEPNTSSTFTMFSTSSNPNYGSLLYIHGCSAPGNTFRMPEELDILAFDEEEKKKETEGRENDLQVYPNPNNGNFKIDFTLSDAFEKLKLTVTNSTGQLISSQDIYNGDGSIKSAEVNLAGQPNGIYILTLSGTNFMQSKRFTIVNNE